VTANAELIDTTTAELGLTINENSVSQLPLNGRDPSALALLSPGVVDAGKAGVSWMQSGFSFPGESAASANGGRIGSTYYMLDGVSNMDNYLGTNSPTPNPDATQEFRLISNNFSAVYGFSTGALFRWPRGAGRTRGMAACSNSCATETWTQGTGATTNRILSGATSTAAMSADRPSRIASSSFSTTREPSSPVDQELRTTRPATPTQQMLAGDFSGLVDYAEAHNSGCGSGYTGPRTLSCGWLNGPFQFANGKPNQVVGGLDPVAVQITNDGLPGHNRASFRDCSADLRVAESRGEHALCVGEPGEFHLERVHVQG